MLTGALRIKLIMGSTPEGEICKHGQALSIKQALANYTGPLNSSLSAVSRPQLRRRYWRNKS